MQKREDFKDDLLPMTMQALSFLSRLPVSSRWFGPGDHRVAETAAAFPLAGLIIALPACLVLLIASSLEFPPLITGLLAVATLIAVTGALHDSQHAAWQKTIPVQLLPLRRRQRTHIRHPRSAVERHIS